LDFLLEELLKSIEINGEVTIMKKWKCTICNYIHEGEEPPEECPICGADSSFFVEVTEESSSSPVEMYYM